MSDNLEQTDNKQSHNLNIGSSRQVITARGTEDGLVLRIDGKADWSEIEIELDELLGGRKKFFSGGEVCLEWLERLPTKEQSLELEQKLVEDYGLKVCHKRRKSLRRLRGGKKTSKIEEIASTSVSKQTNNSDVNPSDNSQNNSIEITNDEDDNFGSNLLQQVEMLADGFDLGEKTYYGIDPSKGPIIDRDISEELRKNYINRVSEVIEEELLFDGDANSKIISGTIRSGQKVETPFSLVVIGDVNPGADLVAGGDIVVIGSLRGTAHAGAYDDKGIDKFILALNMQPVQLRIGSVISRGSSEKSSSAEIARIDNRRIIVEAYNPRSFPLKRKEV